MAEYKLSYTASEIDERLGMVDKLSNITVDSELSSTSENPIQNKAVNAEFSVVDNSINSLQTAVNNKSDITHNHDTVYDTKGSASDALDSAKSYTDTKTSDLVSTSTVNSKISTHNTSSSSHSDIRDLISELTTRLDTLVDGDGTIESYKNYITPQMYGAIGDGITDDTDAIKSCIEYANENKLNIVFENDKSYLVDNSTSINVETSIDFNGSTLILTKGASTPLFKIISGGTKLSLTESILTKFKVLDEQLFGKSFTIVAPLSLGLRNGTGSEHFYTQTLITDEYGYFISGTYNADIISGTYTFSNIQDSFQKTLEFKNVVIDYSQLNDDETAIFIECERNNVKIHNVLVTGSVTLSDWSYHVIGLKNCCNNEIYDINATSPFNGTDASAYILGLYATCNTFLHDCSLGGSLNTWGCIGISYIDNFRAERVLTNRFDCHYYYNGDFIVKDSVFNYFYVCGGNGNVVVENSTLLRDSDTTYGLILRHDLNLIPNGNIIFRNCKFYGITNTLLFYQQNRDDDILDSLLYKETNIIIDKCFVDSDISFVTVQLSDFFDNVNVIIKNCHVSGYCVRATGDAKLKNVEVQSCELINTPIFKDCDNLIINNCYGGGVNINTNTINNLIMKGNFLTPSTITYVAVKNAIIKDNIIMSDNRLVVQGDNQFYIINENIMTSDTINYLGTWNIGSNQTTT